MPMSLTPDQIQQLQRSSTVFEVYPVAKPQNGILDLTKRARGKASLTQKAYSLREAQALALKLSQDTGLKFHYEELKPLPKKEKKKVGRRPLNDDVKVSTYRPLLYLTESQTQLLEGIRSNVPELLALKDSAVVRRLLTLGTNLILEGHDRVYPTIETNPLERKRFKAYKVGLNEGDYQRLLSLNEGTIQNTMLVALLTGLDNLQQHTNLNNTVP
jgi:hypothetical protein